MIRKTFKYRLYPTRNQIALLEGQLAEACRLYNAALQERRDAWRISRVSINYYSQCAQLPEIRAASDTGIVNAQCGQDVLRRVDRTFKAFFARVQRRERAGFPRFKSAFRYDSITFPQYPYGCRLMQAGKLKVHGIGDIKIKLHRSINGKIKTATIKRAAGRWYVCFSVESEAQPLLMCDKSIGIDVGLSSFATLSNGTEIENPRCYIASQAKLRRAQRKVSRRKKGGARRRKAVRLLQRVHARVRNQREDFQHKLSRSLVNQFGLIAVEDLNVGGLAKGMLAKQVNDAAWSAFIYKLTYKAEEAGRELVKVNPRGTSQRCVCGAAVPKTLKERRHSCQSCGLSVSRDHASALEILRLGQSLQD